MGKLLPPQIPLPGETKIFPGWQIPPPWEKGIPLSGGGNPFKTHGGPKKFPQFPPKNPLKTGAPGGEKAPRPPRGAPAPGSPGKSGETWGLPEIWGPLGKVFVETPRKIFWGPPGGTPGGC